MINTYLKLEKIPPESILKLFSDQYAYANGELKVKEVFQKVETSKKIDHYLSGLSNNNIKPTCKAVQILLNTIPYFIFSKAETLCLGGLQILFRWQMQNVEGIEDIGLTQNSRISAELILACSSAKVHTGLDVFSRFFDEIKDYEPIQFDFEVPNKCVDNSPVNQDDQQPERRPLIDLGVPNIEDILRGVDLKKK
jgi:hypothetical protein